MANQEHREVLERGLEAVKEWKQNHPTDGMDFTGANLEGHNLEGFDLSFANFEGANLKGTNLKNALLTQANLSKANLSDAELNEATLTNASGNQIKLNNAILQEANLDGAEITNSDFVKANFEGASFESSKFEEISAAGSIFKNTNFAGAKLARSDFENADFSNTSFRRTRIDNSNLKSANLRGCDFFEAIIKATDFTDTKGFVKVTNLETVRVEGDLPLYFESCIRKWQEKFVDWEKLRIFGRLPLFGASYTLLIMIPLFYYGIDILNDKIELVQAWAQTILSTQTASTITYSFAEIVRDKLQHIPIPGQYLLLLISTVLLATASTIYAFSCPSRIKEFSRDQWVDQLNRPLLHYWTLAWKFRKLRLICFLCYVLGALGAIRILSAKIWRVASLIIENTDWSWKTVVELL